MKDSPIFYRTKTQKGKISDYRYFYRSAIDNALRNNQLKAAQLIIDEAKKHGIFITEDAELVALLSKLELDEDIPDNLFNAVAIILSWVYWLKGMVPGDEKK